MKQAFHGPVWRLNRRRKGLFAPPLGIGLGVGVLVGAGHPPYHHALKFQRLFGCFDAFAFGPTCCRCFVYWVRAKTPPAGGDLGGDGVDRDERD